MSILCLQKSCMLFFWKLTFWENPLSMYKVNKIVYHPFLGEISMYPARWFYWEVVIDSNAHTIPSLLVTTR